MLSPMGAALSWSPPSDHALRTCHGRCLMGSLPALASGSQAPANDHYWAIQCPVQSECLISCSWRAVICAHSGNVTAGMVDSADGCIGAKRSDLFGDVVTGVFLQEV